MLKSIFVNKSTTTFNKIEIILFRLKLHWKNFVLNFVHGFVKLKYPIQFGKIEDRLKIILA